VCSSAKAEILRVPIKGIKTNGIPCNRRYVILIIFMLLFLSYDSSGHHRRTNVPILFFHTGNQHPTLCKPSQVRDPVRGTPWQHLQVLIVPIYRPQRLQHLPEVPVNKFAGMRANRRHAGATICQSWHFGLRLLAVCTTRLLNICSAASHFCSEAVERK
jgi:hypothetical protein